MTKSAKVFFLVYILASVTALILSQLSSTPHSTKPQGLPTTLTVSNLSHYIPG